MAIAIEQTIMRAVGLGNHYNWHNGSGGCAHTRKEAVTKLRSAIDEQIADGAQIAPLDAKCERVLTHIANYGEDHDNSQFMLTKTWQAVASCIQAHAGAAAGSEEAIESFLTAYTPEREAGVDDDGYAIDQYGCPVYYYN